MRMALALSLKSSLMRASEFVSASSNRGSIMSNAVHLCRWVQGVSFRVNHCGRMVDALVLRDALESCFDAGAAPGDWLRSYERHRQEVHRAARAAYCDRPRSALVVLCTSDLEPFVTTAA